MQEKRQRYRKRLVRNHHQQIFALKRNEMIAALTQHNQHHSQHNQHHSQHNQHHSQHNEHTRQAQIRAVKQQCQIQQNCPLTSKTLQKYSQLQHKDISHSLQEIVQTIIHENMGQLTEQEMDDLVTDILYLHIEQDMRMPHQFQFNMEINKISRTSLAALTLYFHPHLDADAVDAGMDLLDDEDRQYMGIGMQKEDRRWMEGNLLKWILRDAMHMENAAQALSDLFLDQYCEINVKNIEISTVQSLTNGKANGKVNRKANGKANGKVNTKVNAKTPSLKQVHHPQSQTQIVRSRVNEALLHSDKLTKQIISPLFSLHLHFIKMFSDLPSKHSQVQQMLTTMNKLISQSSVDDIIPDLISQFISLYNINTQVLKEPQIIRIASIMYSKINEYNQNEGKDTPSEQNTSVQLSKSYLYRICYQFWRFQSLKQPNYKLPASILCIINGISSMQDESKEDYHLSKLMKLHNS